MEKKVYDLKVDPELRDLIPPLSEEEHRMLEDSIVRDGCDTPLTVWDGIIVDGHNRYEICVRHNIPFAYEERHFEDRDAAVFWMLEHQLARRNLNSYQRSLLALRFEPMLKKVAKGKQGKRNDLDTNFRTNLSGSSTSYSAEKMAELAGVSPTTIKKVKRLEKEADEETKKQLRKGDTSIHKAYTEIMNKEHEGETRVCECCQQEKPFSEFRLPSNRKNVRPICKECEAKAKQAAKEAEIAASLPVPPEVSGIGIKDGQTAHISLGLPDNPAMFEQMIALLQHAQDAYIASFRSTIAQYRPSMISEDHTNMIMEMIDNIANDTEEILNTHLMEVVEK